MSPPISALSWHSVVPGTRSSPPALLLGPHEVTTQCLHCGNTTTYPVKVPGADPGPPCHGGEPAHVHKEPHCGGEPVHVQKGLCGAKMATRAAPPLHSAELVHAQSTRASVHAQEAQGSDSATSSGPRTLQDSFGGFS